MTGILNPEEPDEDEDEDEPDQADVDQKPSLIGEPETSPQESQAHRVKPKTQARKSPPPSQSVANDVVSSVNKVPVDRPE